MKFRSENMTAASGSIGGVTYAHARGGQMYRRARATPINPNTAEQQRTRAAVAAASAGWNTLTTPQRELWTAYALATPVPGAFGQTQTLTGQQMYVRLNAFRSSVNLTASATPPTTPGNVELGIVNVAPQDGNDITITWNLAAAWNTNDGRLLVRMSPFRAAGCSFIKSPLRRATVVEVGATPVATEIIPQNGWGETPDGRVEQCLGFAARAMAADGRISETFYGTARVIV